MARYAQERMLFSVYFCNVNETAMIVLLITLIFMSYENHLKNNKLK